MDLCIRSTLNILFNWNFCGKFRKKPFPQISLDIVVLIKPIIVKNTPNYCDHDKSIKFIAVLEPQLRKFIGVEIPKQRAIIKKYKAF